ncbi:MAG: IclR family transcriptional regulator C-terminal domain-containing protein [Halieaceae bacterium]|jgi:IclR family pca regulon transcriptional regulator|nr:IclR family transcriptional regulator C-terminal domain-containing protein [Halieaceae bacterium]
MTAANPPKDSEYLSTLERGLSVLRAFSRERPEMTLSEVAAVTGLSPAVARRCLHTLVTLGYVARQEKRFLLTAEVMAFASAFLESMNLEQVVRPHLQEVRDETGDSSSMAVFSDPDVLYLVHVSTNRMVRLAAGVGTRFPAHATSLGRIIVAHQPAEMMERYLAETPLTRYTEKTIVDRTRLAQILRQAARNDYASIQDELDYGIVSVAVPVRAGDSEVIAAINCSTATSRVDPGEMLDTRLPVLRRAARAIEIELQRYPVLVNSIRAAGRS